MGKKSEPIRPATATAESPEPMTKPAANIEAPAAKPPAAALKAANGEAARAKPTVKKKPAKAAPKKKPVGFSPEDIALRAYFIAEHRHRHHIHGDAHSDWIEAERQLKAEHRKKPAKEKVARPKKRA